MSARKKNDDSSCDFVFYQVNVFQFVEMKLKVDFPFHFSLHILITENWKKLNYTEWLSLFSQKINF